MLAARGWISSLNSKRVWRPRWLREERPTTRRSCALGAKGAGGRGSPMQCNRAASSPTQTTIYTNTYGLEVHEKAG